MSDQQLEETNVDVIVLGTGLEESILAGSLARIGKKVIHLDQNKYYGDAWATLNLKELKEWLLGMEHTAEPYMDNFVELIEPEADTKYCIEVPQKNSPFSEIEIWPSHLEGNENTTEGANHSTDTTTTTSTKETTIVKSHFLDPMLERFRRYNIDLSPRLVLSKGSMVELLVQSGVGRYLEFRNAVSLQIANPDGSITEVPMTQSEVFKNKSIQLKEKRFLTRFLKFCLAYDEAALSEIGNATAEQLERLDRGAMNDLDSVEYFAEFVANRGLSKELQDIVLYAVAQLELPQTVLSDGRKGPLCTTKEGIMKVQNHLRSLGVYGRTAFLYPLYGSSEFEQAFCRLCAVFGGVYVLDRSAQRLIFQPRESGGVEFIGLDDSSGQRLESSWLILGPSYIPNSLHYLNDNKDVEESSVCRCMLIIEGNPIDFSGDSGESVEENDKNSPRLAVFPPNTLASNSAPINVIQMDNNVDVCPTGQFLVHMNCTSSTLFDNESASARSVLEPAVTRLFGELSVNDAESNNTNSHKIHWCVFYRQGVVKKNTMVEEPSHVKEMPANVLLCKYPDCSLSYDGAISRAKSMFQKICPNEEFLPRAPEPEELIMDEDGSVEVEG